MAEEDDFAAIPAGSGIINQTTPTRPPHQRLASAAKPARPQVSTRYIWLLVLAIFGTYVAFVTPIAFSLAVRVKELAPDNEEYLGYIIGSASVLSILYGPVFGILSDRTRSLLGRRRPWILGGALVGTGGLFVMAIAPDIPLLFIGWVVATIGWNTVISGMTNSQADRLPEFQRGRVGGLVGFVTMAAPVFGAITGGLLVANAILLLMVPAAIGLVLVALFLILISEPDSRANTFSDRLDLRLILAKFLFDPRRYPDFSWNWLGRFLFFFGLTLNSTFTAFFFAQRLGLPITGVGGLIAAAGGISVIAVSIAALGSGFLSDKLRRRKPFVIASGSVFALGAVVMAFSSGIPLLLVGSFITSLALGVFSAVDQALVLDVLPERETDAGRFNAINGLSHSLAQASAPLIAPTFLAMGVLADGDKNYGLLYLIAAGFTILGGLAVMKVKSVR